MLKTRSIFFFFKKNKDLRIGMINKKNLIGYKNKFEVIFGV